MKKTENRRNKVQMPAGIRQKMMAAVSMLMVSCIMMVSSTYAWFTLSTAPEVTGITTNVGANGNLEMMLLTETSYRSTEDDLGVATGINDSTAVIGTVNSNVKWGNLVDLTDASYGLNKLTLSPARLNIEDVTSGADKIGTTILNAPSYGTDGRVVNVNKATYTGKFNSASSSFKFDDNYKGVRVLGTTTTISDRLAAYRSSKEEIGSKAVHASTIASDSLKANGQKLANILVGYTQNPNMTLTYGDARAIESILKSLDSAREDVASAIKNAVIAHNLSSSNNVALTDAHVENLQAVVNGVSISEGSSVTGGLTAENFTSLLYTDGTTSYNVAVPSDENFTNAISVYNKMNSEITNALNGLYTQVSQNILSNKEEYPDSDGAILYSTLSNVLDSVVARNGNLVIADVANPNSTHIADIALYVLSNGYVTINMGSTTGTYADLAELVGNYNASGFKVSITHSVLGDKPLSVDVIMSTDVDDGPYVTGISIAGEYAETGQVADAVLSNTYGYALDFGFRTNAAASKLLLQTASKNRVYTNDVTVENLVGGGSYMQFESVQPDSFSKTDVLALMSAIRVAFISSSTNEVLGIAAMDIATTVDEATGLTSANITDENTVTVLASENGYKGELYLRDYTISDGKIILGDKLANNGELLALTQNKASKVTVIVYLDGDYVDNTMVANAEQSMSGHMNLQFSSNATLVPMDNTSLKAGGVPTQTTGVDVQVVDSQGE